MRLNQSCAPAPAQPADCRCDATIDGDAASAGDHATVDEQRVLRATGCQVSRRRRLPFQSG